MTLNQILERIQTVSLSHKQVRNHYYGKPTDFLTEKTTRYASTFLQDNDGTIGIASKQMTVAFKFYVLDLVNAADDTLQNIKDVQSDCLEIAKDILALLNSNSYNDWALSTDNSFTFLFEAFDDLVAGVVVDFSVRTPYESDECAVPIIEQL